MTTDLRLDRNAFRTAMSCFASGVTVVTTRDEDDTPFGFTANSFCSVSLEPPLILVCLARTANCYPVFTTCRRFAVSVLADHHHDVARRFATKQEDKFEGTAFTSAAHSLPAVEGALCVLSCDIEDLVDAGDHAILLGRVYHARVRQGTPMIYYNSTFHQLSRED
jgi:flavin reductase ActVB